VQPRHSIWVVPTLHDPRTEKVSDLGGVCLPLEMDLYLRLRYCSDGNPSPCAQSFMVVFMVWRIGVTLASGCKKLFIRSLLFGRHVSQLIYSGPATVAGNALTSWIGRYTSFFLVDLFSVKLFK
jgi:hypothetical protein